MKYSMTLYTANFSLKSCLSSKDLSDIPGLNYCTTNTHFVSKRLIKNDWINKCKTAKYSTKLKSKPTTTFKRKKKHKIPS